MFRLETGSCFAPQPSLALAQASHRIVNFSLHAMNGPHLEHQCSEMADEVGHWAPATAVGEWGSGRRPNHWWDTAYMSFTMAEIVRAHLSAPCRRTPTPSTNAKPEPDYAMMQVFAQLPPPNSSLALRRHGSYTILRGKSV
jgi:hypothetical protein